MTPDRVRSARWRFRHVSVVLFVLAAILGGCGRAEEVRWRDVTLEVPEGWVVNEFDRSRLSIANARFPDLDAADIPPGPARPALEAVGPAGPAPEAVGLVSDLEAAVFFTHEPNATVAAWRAFVVEQQGTLDEDVRLTIDGAPATRLVFTYDANGTLTREMILLVPARELVGLFQPITPRFSREGPSRFDHYRPTFDAIVDSMDFGAPLREARGKN